MKQYLQLIKDVYENGKDHADRTGVGRRSVFGRMMRFNLADGFPLLTTKPVFFKGILHENLWFLSGDTNIKYLVDNGVHIWDKFADQYGNLGPVYGKQFRSIADTRVIPEELLEHYEFLGFGDCNFIDLYDDGVVVSRQIDQVGNLIENLKERPFSSRHVMTLWDPRFIPGEEKKPHENVEDGQMALASCHGTAIQFLVEEIPHNERWEYGATADVGMIEICARQPGLEKIELVSFIGDQGIEYKKLIYRYEGTNAPEQDDVDIEIMDYFNVPKYRLNCMSTQRSVDVILGLPFNIAGYALLTMMIAQCVNMAPGELIYSMGDVHLYKNAIEVAKIQALREPRTLPKLWIDPTIKNIDDFNFEHFKLLDYDPHPPLPKVEVAV